MSVILPRAVAVFETELAQSITDSDTIMYLSSALTKDGDELEADKWYGFVIEQGTLNEEFVIGQVDSSNRKMIKNLKRGISYKDGQTEITSLKKNHSRGASVRITDAPILPAIVDAFNDAIENFNNEVSQYARFRVKSNVISSTDNLIPDLDQYNYYKIENLSSNLTINNPIGNNLSLGMVLVILIKDNGTSRNIYFGDKYKAIGVSLPTLTNPNKFMEIIAEYDGSNWLTSCFNEV